jgi:hypothetical protein
MNNLKHQLLLVAALFTCIAASAQTSPPQTTIKLFFEKVYVHTDRVIYAPGEDLWFKAYVINAHDNHLISTSKSLYVDLVAPGDSIVSKEIVHLDNGMAKGDLVIKTKLPAGTYRLRAYTNWMRNFGDNFVFERPIIITGETVAGKPVAISNKNNKGIANQSVANSGSSPTLRFFPEGGSLINGISTIIAVKAEDARGNGIPVSGPIISATGDTIAKFNCDTLGMGLFTLLPIAGQSYYTTIKYGDQKITAQLPPALTNGLALKVSKKDSIINVVISNNATSGAVESKLVTLTVKHAGSTIVDQQITLSGNQVSVKIPESILPEGIAAFTLYDEQHKPNCERLVYVKHTISANKFAVSIDKNSYKPRERVNVNIKINDIHNKPVTGNLSLAVVDAGLNPIDDSNIMSYFMLQSEIKGRIEHAERYFDTTNVNRAAQLNLLLLTQGWRDFVWKRLADAPINISYLPEQGFTLSGRVKKETGHTIADANITLSAPKASGQKLFFTKTDANGNYYFDNLQLFGEQNVRVSTRNIKGEANGVIELDSLSKQGLAVQKPAIKNPYQLNPELAAEVSKRAPLIHSLDSVTNLNEVKIRGNRRVVLRDQTALTYGYPDEVLVPKGEDLKFANLRAYILYASNQAKPDASGENIVFYAEGKTYKPRIIVDNSELPFTEDDDADILDHYYNSYFNLPMSVVDKVVVKRLLGGLQPPAIGGTETANAMGATVSGASAVKPKNLFLIYLTLKPGALQRNYGGITTANIQGYYETRTFYKPIHNNTGFDSPKPDMRNTIHWEPLIKTDATGAAKVSFYNADPKTGVRIIVQGITDTGEPVSAVKNYVVK